MTVASDNLARLATALGVPIPDGDPDDGYVLYAGGGDYAVHLSIHASPVAALEHYAQHVTGLPFRCVVALIAMEAASGTFDVELPPPTVEQYVAQICDRLGLDAENNDVEPDCHPSEPILLIEKNEHGGLPPYYLTTHETVADALDYNVRQECADDWTVWEVHDLRGPREITDELTEQVKTESVAHIGAQIVASDSPLVEQVARFALDVGRWHAQMGLSRADHGHSAADQLAALYEILNRYGLTVA